MNILTSFLYRNHIIQNLTTQIIYNASKMQASSTQKTKDSPGKRLGYLSVHQESKNLEDRLSIPMISLLGKEDSSGNQDRMLL